MRAHMRHVFFLSWCGTSRCMASVGFHCNGIVWNSRSVKPQKGYVEKKMSPELPLRQWWVGNGWNLNFWVNQTHKPTFEWNSCCVRVWNDCIADWFSNLKMGWLNQTGKWTKYTDKKVPALTADCLPERGSHQKKQTRLSLKNTLWANPCWSAAPVT